MEYDLLKFRNFQVTPETDSMKLLYFYGKYKKDREDAAQASRNPAQSRMY